MTATERDPSAGAEQLISFVPRLTIEWLRDAPDRTWQEVEGTVAFVDISGFTAMSERLSQLGKAGAEEVNEVMNATFAALLELAYSFGGGLLKFGGDALLLLYDGPDHTARATRAAFEMRALLETIGRPDTSAGTVELRMHVGLHSGLFHFFLVGDSHRELLVCGPAASRTVEMEAASEAGEILLSPEAVEEIESSCIGEPKGLGFLLANPPDVEGELEPLPDVTGLDLEQAVPKPLRAQLLEVGPLEAEHRQAAISFVRFQEIDDLIAREGAEGAAAALDTLAKTIQAAADEYGVTFLESDIDRNGGRIILVSGAPQTHGGDEERLLRTLRAVADASPPLPLHVGASRGRVFAGQVGFRFRRTYTILGDTAALAARLMARAEANQILVAEAAYQAGGASFAATALEPFMVKGKAEPVQAFELGALEVQEVDVEAPPAPAKDLPFVDRQRERAVLAASLAPVRMGFGSLVELIGEPGIGKSRLAADLREQCADMTTLHSRCQEYESSTPYHAFRPLLRSLLDVSVNGDPTHNRDVLSERLSSIDGELAPWAPLLSAPLDIEVESTQEVDDLDPSFRRARLHGFVGSLFGKLLDSPTLMLFEDVHWMDEASSDLLRHIGAQVSTHPWLACTTRRAIEGGFAAADGTPPLPAMTLRLEPLPVDDAKTLLEAASGGRRLTDDEVQAIMERAAGNPLFLQELAGVEEEEAAEELPDTVGGLVATKIDQLAPGDRALLRWASVLGTSFPGAVIAEVLEDDPSAASDSEAWDRLAEFVERDPDVAGGFRFRHALIRDAAYEGLSFRRRRELHGRVGDVLERRQGANPEDIAEVLSLHYREANRWQEAWGYSRSAGARAQEKWANVEASQFYRHALDAAKELPELSPDELTVVWESLGDCLWLIGELEQTMAAFASARELLPEKSPNQIELMRKSGLVAEDQGQYDDAIEWYDRGLALVEHMPEGDERTHHRLTLRMSYAQARFRQGAFEDCIEVSKEVAAQALEAGEDRNLALAFTQLHIVYLILGAPEHRAYSGLALPLLEELGDLRGQATALNNMGIEAYYDGDWDKAIDLYGRSGQLYRRIGDDVTQIHATNNTAEILSDQGKLEEAERMFQEAVSVADATGQEPMSAAIRANLGRAAARAGRFDEAEELLDGAIESFTQIGSLGFVAETELRRAELAALKGDDPQTVMRLTAALVEQKEEAHAMPPLQSTAHRVRGVAFLQLGLADLGIPELDKAIEIAREGNAAYELALALDLRGSAGSGDPEAAEESKELLERLGVERISRPPLPA